MARITEEMKEVASKTKGFALATVTKDGAPHVIPVYFGKVLSDDEFLVADVFMKQSVDNIKANPKVSISAWDMESLKGYEFKGNARIETSGKAFDDTAKWVKGAFPQLSAKAAIVVKIDSICIRTPGPDAGKEVS